MPFSSGTYTPASPQYPFISGLLIVAADMNTVIADIATALSTTLLRDGTSTPTADLPLGGFKLTGVGDALARNQYATYGQLQDSEANWVEPASVTGTANAVLLAITPAPTAYDAGQTFWYQVKIANTAGAVTHNVNSLGALNTKKVIGGAKVDLAIGDLSVGKMVILQHDGTDLVLLNPMPYSQGADIADSATPNFDTATGDMVDFAGTTTTTGCTLAQGRQILVRFTGIRQLTNGASFVIPGGTRTTAVGDFAIFRGYAAGVVRCVGYFKADGTGLTTTAGRLIGVQYFTASGTYTPTAGMATCEVEAVGGGGGTGGSAAVANQLGNGASGAGYVKKTFTAAQIGASQAVGIGAGGLAGTNAPTAGGNGGATTLGALLTAAGGIGGNVAGVITLLGPAGGVGAGGDFNLSGEAGFPSMFDANAIVSGRGGSAPMGLGRGGQEVKGLGIGSLAGNPGTGYGAGASGCKTGSSAAAVGGSVGSGGLMIIREYS